MPATEALIAPKRLGAHPLPDGSCEFLVWAPNANSVFLRLGNGELIEMEQLPHGYHHVHRPRFGGETRYFYLLDHQRDLPDPASRFQPDGVHGPSQVVDTTTFRWTDAAWRGIPLESSIFYELHVGTYTRAGSFEALIPYLPELVDLGVTTIELMPVAQFPGSRNWGYDGVYPFAPQNSYGGPLSLQRLVNSAHACGLAVALDVVYNHLGPEGNYLNAFGPYFTDRYRTPWGQAINFDGQGSDDVRRFFIENALYWLEDYHIDALRLDAVHGIFDFGARHFLAELKIGVEQLSARLGRRLDVIAESDLNDSRLLHSPAQGGYGLDAQWSDDFHHSVHTLLTKEGRGYYSDFGGIRPLAETLRKGWYYSGQYSTYRKRRHGNSPDGLAPSKFVVCTQNHDQVGNRANGDRLTALVDFDSLKLAAGINLLSPFIPLLLMGEEYGETAPFQYFTSHGDPSLIEAVRRGRREEFAAFGWQQTVPDPQEEETYERSHLDHSLKAKGSHQTLRRFYRELMHIRAGFDLGSARAYTVRELDDNGLLVILEGKRGRLATVFNFSGSPLALSTQDLTGEWTLLLDSAAECWNGPSSPESPAAATSSGTLELAPRSFRVLAAPQFRMEAR